MDLGDIRSILYTYPNVRRLLTPAILFRQYLRKRHERHMQPAYDNLCDIVADDPVINLPEFHGKFFVDCRSDLFRRVIFYKTYESELSKIVLKYLDRSRDVIDVGANAGFFSVLFAKEIVGKRVLAIEPTKSALMRLHKNIEINCLQKSITVFEGVASNSDVPIQMKVIEGKCEYSTIGEMMHPSISGEKYGLEEVSSSTLDDLIERYSIDPGFIKIDVEGSEHLVFDGARRMLEKCRPIIISELSDPLLRANGSSSKEVIDIISRYDYKIVDALVPNLAGGVRKYGDILCIPKEVDALTR